MNAGILMNGSCIETGRQDLRTCGRNLTAAQERETTTPTECLWTCETRSTSLSASMHLDRIEKGRRGQRRIRDPLSDHFCLVDRANQKTIRKKG